MEDKEIALRLKAELICSGVLHIPREISIPFPTSKSSAGPGAGGESIVVCFSGKRVKVPISRAKGDLELRAVEDKFEILKDGHAIISGVTLLPTLCHAPGQAFVSLGRSCKMKCLFCTINEAGNKTKEITVDDAYRMIIAASEKEDFQSVAITSGIRTTVEEQIEEIAELISRVREKLPDVSIGAEPLAIEREHVKALKESGADEIKINLEAANKEIFNKICPARDYDRAIEAIGWAVEFFGKGHVTSNIIVGLGESDDDVSRSLEMLAKIGSMGNLRALRLNDHNRNRLSHILGNDLGLKSERMISLARIQNDIFEKYGLSASNLKTMCFPCGCCDLIPGIDI